MIVAAGGVALLLAVLAGLFGAQANQNATAANQNAQAAAVAQATSIANAATAQQAKGEADTQRDAARQSEANALTQQRIATARELAATALTNLGVDAQRSVLLALQAVKTTQEQDKIVLPEAEDALHRAVLASRAQLKLGPSERRMWRAVYNPDGRQIATRVDGLIQLWDAKTGKEVLQIPITAAYATAATAVGTADYDNVVFSSDGTQTGDRGL